MERPDVQAWLDGYVDAWRQNKPELIEALFSENAVYRYRPFSAEGEVLIGRAAIVESWLREAEDPKGWEADYEVFAVDEDRGVATRDQSLLRHDLSPGPPVLQLLPDAIRCRR